jgi:hypothetical protein
MGDVSLGVPGCVVTRFQNTIFCNHMRLTHLTMLASLERSSKCAASTAETMAPSSADKSQVSSVTRNFLARLKNAAGPFDALTAITCLAGGSVSCDDGCVLSDGWSL